MFYSRFPTYRVVFMQKLPISHVCLSPVETLKVFPFLMRGFPTVILITRVLIFARDDSHVVIFNPPLGVLGPGLGPFYELQVPFYRYTYAQIT